MEEVASILSRYKEWCHYSWIRVLAWWQVAWIGNAPTKNIYETASFIRISKTFSWISSILASYQRPRSQRVSCATWSSWRRMSAYLGTIANLLTRLQMLKNSYLKWRRRKCQWRRRHCLTTLEWDPVLQCWLSSHLKRLCLIWEESTRRPWFCAKESSEPKLQLEKISLKSVKFFERAEEIRISKESL